ncbi:hypothetical protein [Aquabacterium humicola]|uniref:hypothetical protein n=1 Tax=Aquabacterium humicola TaxID=3237377 RepID=UPI002542B55E|nr:hypothetical protein [Rubrivivax pictus]
MPFTDPFLQLEPGLAFGRLHATEDVDCFRVELVQGERYFVELIAHGPIDLALLDDHGEALATGGNAVTDRGMIRSSLSFVAPANGTYALQVTGGSANWVQPTDYALSIGTTNVDDVPDERWMARRIELGGHVDGTLDLSQDIDCFALALAAGQRVQVTIRHSAPFPNEDPVVRVLGPNDNDVREISSGAVGISFAFSATSAGTYFIELRNADGTTSPGDANVLSYHIETALLPPDDHADGYLGATSMKVGTEATGRIELSGDRDWFRVDLAFGQRYRITLVDDQALVDNDLVVSLGAGGYELVRSDPDAGLVYRAMGGGTYYIAVEGSNDLQRATSPVGYRLRVEPIPADDRADTPGDASLLAVGGTATFRFDGGSDVDVFRFEAVAGQRYVAEIKGPTGTSGRTDAFFIEDGEPVPTHVGEARYRDLQPASSWYFTADTSGPVYLALLPRTLDLSADWRVELRAVAPDDHAESAAAATPLALGSPLTGALSGPGDEDLFAVSLVAGQAYSFALTTPLDLPSMWYPDFSPRLEVSLAGGAQPLLTVDGHWPAGMKGALFFAPADGVYIVRPRFVTSYTVQVEHWQPGADDEADLPANGEWLNANTGFEPAGLPLIGSESDDVLTGSARPDFIQAGAGNDRIESRLDGDVVEGGDGIDTLVVDATLGTMLAEYAGGRWTLTNLSAGGAASLTAVERVQGTDAGLALDLDGHAGSVARVLGALFGPQAVADRALVGLGLSLLDAGLDYPTLVAAAVDSELFRAQAGGAYSHAAFVDIVYRHVFGHAPTADERAAYVALIDQGSVTQAQLAQLACDSVLNAANIGLAGLQDSGLAYLPVVGAS